MIDEALAKIIDKLSSVVDANAAAAITLGGRVLQLQVATTMMASVVGFALAVFCTTRFLRWYRDPSWPTEKNGDLSDPPTQVIAWGIAAGGFGLIGGGGFIMNVLSPLNWAILFDARLAVAAKVLGLI